MARSRKSPTRCRIGHGSLVVIMSVEASWAPRHQQGPVRSPIQTTWSRSPSTQPGDPILLEEQDRSLWNQVEAEEGRDLPLRALMRRAVAMVEDLDRGLELVDVIGQTGALPLSRNAADHRFLTGRLSECDVAGDDPEGPAAN